MLTSVQPVRSPERDEWLKALSAGDLIDMCFFWEETATIAISPYRVDGAYNGYLEISSAVSSFWVADPKNFVGYQHRLVNPEGLIVGLQGYAWIQPHE